MELTQLLDDDQLW